jgi:competence protein ComEC
VESFLERERGQLPSWLVVGFAAGIACWFVLDGPGEWLAVLCFGAGLAVLGFVFEGGRLERGVAGSGLLLLLDAA